MLKSSRNALGGNSNGKNKSLSDFQNLKKVTIDQPYRVFSEKALDNESKDADYGILALLEGDWFSYVEPNSKRVSNIAVDAFKDNISSGVHTTIMPSPGMDHNKIPGKYSFVCDEYIEKLSFDLVPGGVRNRGGATEQFCGAIKYEQNIQSVNNDNGVLKFEPIHVENGMYLWLSDLYGHFASKDSIEEDRGVHRWNTASGIVELIGNLYPSPPSAEERKSFEKLVADNPYLDVDFLNVGTLEQPHYVLEKDLNGRPFVSFMEAKELQPGEGFRVPKFIPDYSISRSGVIPHGSTITLLGDAKSIDDKIVQEDKPSFIQINPKVLEILNTLGISKKLLLAIYDEPTKDKIINILNNLDHEKRADLSLALYVDNNLDGFNIIEKILNALKLIVANAYWDYKHLAFSKTMGGGISPTNKTRPFNFNYPPLPFTKMADFDSANDQGEEEVYVQRLFTHDLYPYSTRPDLRLQDAIKEQSVQKFIQISLSSKQKTGASGGVLNIPFVDRFVPTTSVTFNLWIEEVEEQGRIFTQLQYEQIVLFEFGFGDSGGTTSWPHIQVNTLRKYEDLNEYSKKFAENQFGHPKK